MLSHYYSTVRPDDTGEIRRIARVEASKMIPQPGPVPVDGSLVAVVSLAILALSLVGYVSAQRDALDLHPKGVLLTAVGTTVILAVVLTAAWVQDRRQALRVDNIAARVDGVAARIDTLTDIAGQVLESVAAMAAEQEQSNALVSRALSGDGGRLSVAIDRTNILRLAGMLADRRAAGDERPAEEMSEREWKIYMSGVFDGQNRAGESGEPPLG